MIRQAEMLRELGVKPTKALPAALVDRPENQKPCCLRELTHTVRKTAEQQGMGACEMTHRE